MRWVGDDRQVRQFFEHWNGINVKGVARGRFIGSDAAFADHDVHVAPGQNVFGAHQQFLDRAADAAFEKDRLSGLAQRLEQRVVLRVASPYLEDVGVFADEFDIVRTHDLGDDR